MCYNELSISSDGHRIVNGHYYMIYTGDSYHTLYDIESGYPEYQGTLDDEVMYTPEAKERFRMQYKIFKESKMAGNA